MAQRTVAVTVDDLPMAIAGGDNAAGNINDVAAATSEIVGALDRGKIPAIGFVNESKVLVPGEVDKRTAVLRAWLAAGLTLGNHSFSHPNVKDTSLTQFEDDVIKGEIITRPLMQQFDKHLKYFRFPFNSTGETREKRDGIRQFLSARGYVIAPTTISNEDWIWNVAYVKAKSDRNFELAEKIRNAYLDYIDPKFDYFEKLSQRMFQRQIPQVLLLHANDLNADALRFLLERIRKRGYTFISLDDAMKDAAYQQPDDYVGPNGLGWFQRWELTKSQPLYAGEPSPPQWVTQAASSR